MSCMYDCAVYFEQRQISKGHEFHKILYWNNIKPVGKNSTFWTCVFYEWCIVSNSSSIDYSMFHVRSCNNCVNMHVYKTLNRANGTNLPEGWLEQRRSMSLVQIWKYPLEWVDEYFGGHHNEEVTAPNSHPMHSHQLHGHNTEMISKHRKIEKDEYIFCLKNIVVCELSTKPHLPPCQKR